MQVLQSWRRQEVKDASAFSKKTRGDGISRVGLGAVQVFTDVLAAFCCSVTAETFGNATSFGAGTISIGFQLLFFYFAAGAFLDLFRLGAIIGTAAGLGANSKTLYAAIETLAGDNTGLALVDKAQAAVSSTKIVLALNSVRRVLKVRQRRLTMCHCVTHLSPHPVATATIILPLRSSTMLCFNPLCVKRFMISLMETMHIIKGHVSRHFNAVLQYGKQFGVCRKKWMMQRSQMAPCNSCLHTLY